MKIIYLLIEFFRLIIATIVFPTLFSVGFIYTTIKHFYKLDYSTSKQFQPIIRSVSLALDGLANSGAGELLNDFLKVKGKIKYGKWYQTISAITGLISIYEKDTRLRKFLDKVLGRNHCVDAITEQDNFYYKNN